MLWRIGGVQDLSEPIFWRDVLSEVLVSWFLLTFLTFNQVNYFGTWDITPTHAGLVMGLTLFVLVESFGHLGGAHFNPGVTFIVFCRGEISMLKGKTSSTWRQNNVWRMSSYDRSSYVLGMLYTIAQMLGGAAGSGIIYG